MYSFSKRSVDKLQDVHPDLIKLFTEAIKDSPCDFGITEGRRALIRQRELVTDGKSRTMNSRHLTGHAVDIAVFIGGEINWEFKHYTAVADHIKKVAATMNIPIVWGGDWISFKDGPHFELRRKEYP